MRHRERARAGVRPLVLLVVGGDSVGRDGAPRFGYLLLVLQQEVGRRQRRPTRSGRTEDGRHGAGRTGGVVAGGVRGGAWRWRWWWRLAVGFVRSSRGPTSKRLTGRAVAVNRAARCTYNRKQTRRDQELERIPNIFKTQIHRFHLNNSCAELSRQKEKGRNEGLTGRYWKKLQLQYINKRLFHLNLLSFLVRRFSPSPFEFLRDFVFSQRPRVAFAHFALPFVSRPGRGCSRSSARPARVHVVVVASLGWSQ